MSRTLAIAVGAALALGACRSAPAPAPVVVDPTPALREAAARVGDAVQAATDARATALDVAVAARIAQTNAMTDAVVTALRVQRDACPPFDADGFDDPAVHAAIDEARGAVAALTTDGADPLVQGAATASVDVLDAADALMDAWPGATVEVRVEAWQALQARHATWRDALARLDAAMDATPWDVWFATR